MKIIFRFVRKFSQINRATGKPIKDADIKTIILEGDIDDMHHLMHKEMAAIIENCDYYLVEVIEQVGKQRRIDEYTWTMGRECDIETRRDTV